MNKKIKTIILIFSILAILTLLPILFVFYGIPKIASHPKFLTWVEDYVEQNYNADLIIDNPQLNISKNLIISS